MTIPVLLELIQLVESLFQHHAPEVVGAAEQAAIQTAEQQAAVDPKVQAGIVAYQALQNFKAAISVPPTPPPAA